jgi:hypothetical protein
LENLLLQLLLGMYLSNAVLQRLNHQLHQQMCLMLLRHKRHRHRQY